MSLMACKVASALGTGGGRAATWAEDGFWERSLDAGGLENDGGISTGGVPPSSGVYCRCKHGRVEVEAGGGYERKRTSSHDGDMGGIRGARGVEDGPASKI